MLRRSSLYFLRVAAALLVALTLLGGVGCKKNQATNPLAHVNSKQPDKVLYDRAIEAMKQKKYETARLTLQTMISAYPDSEYVAKAKLTIGDAWYQEGTEAGLTQAESEYRDFITFFPNLPEAAQAQLKIADIHFQQMGKPDRDFTHAHRAQEEYRQLLLQYPDSKLVDEARVKLLEVQEVLAEREYRIARFYYQRGSLLAAIARTRTLVDSYPLYSHADEALFMLGQAYEQEADLTRASSLAEAAKQRLIKDDLGKAAEAYSRIATRYPAMARYHDAGARLAAMKIAVPTPTPEALAQNQKEQASRTVNTAYERFLADMGKRPDIGPATKVGQASMTDPKQTDAPELAREINSEIKGETVAASATGTLVTQPAGSGATAAANQPTRASAALPANPSDIPEKAPDQLNESQSSSSANGSSAASSSSSTAPNEHDDAKNSSSSHKAKKKHHFHIPLPL